MTGLGETDATTTMIILNAHNAKRRKAGEPVTYIRYAVLTV